MSRRNSRLHRTLPGHSSLFTAASDPLDLFDDDLTHLTVHRGPGQRGGGWAASTLELGTPMTLAPTLAGHNVALYLRAGPAADLAARTYADPARLERRFTGRLATQEVADRGDGRTPLTTVRAASWLARMSDSKRTSTPTAGRTVKRTVEDALGVTDGSVLRGITPESFGTFDRVAVTEDKPLTWSQLLGKYVTDPGYLMRESRAGRTGLMSLPYLATYATDAAATQLPLARSEAIRPTSWQMKNERPAADQRYTYRRATDGAVMTSTASLPNNTDELAGTDDIDWAHLYRDTTQMEQEAYGRAYSSHVRFYRLPSITVDLLHLIGSPREYHRRVAGQLLMLEVYDPVALSGDWPWQVRGIHHAVGISERITRSSWDMEIALVPHAQMVGALPPAPREVLWDQMTKTWDNTPGTWDSYAPATP